MRSPCRTIQNHWFLLLIVSLLTTAFTSDSQGQNNPNAGTKAAGDWTVSFQPYEGPGHESPYRILNMKVEALDGYLYLSDLQLSIPPNRAFFTIEYTAFVYKEDEPHHILLKKQVYRMGTGDGEFSAEGLWLTPVGKKWGTPLTSGDDPLMAPLMHVGLLEGHYRIAIGISHVSFGGKDVWDLVEVRKTNSMALLDAARNDDVDSLRTLVAAGANVNATDQYGTTALLLAANSGYTKSISFLLTAGADVNLASANGNTALMLAAQYGHLEAVKALLKAKADINAWNEEGMAPLLLAGFGSRSEVWDLLKSAGATIGSPADAMLCEAAFGHTSDVVQMLEAGVDINAKGRRDYTALILSSLNGHIGTVKYLLQHGADPNATDKYGWPALKFALFAHHPDAMKLLVSVGADVNKKDMYGATPLITAVQCLYLEGAQQLLSAGADPTLKDNTGKVALDYALEQSKTGPVRENDEMVKLLKSAAPPRQP